MKTTACGIVLLVLLLVAEGAHASCTVKNNSGKTIVLIPVIDVHVNIVVKVGEVVQVPTKYEHCHVKNLGNGHTSAPIALVDGSVTVVVDGSIQGTVKLLVGGLINGVISIVANAIVLVQI